MELNLKGKVILVSGSSKGIGKAIAFAFLKEGAKVVITGLADGDFDLTSLEAKKIFGDSVLLFSGNLTKEEEIKKCVETAVGKWGVIDILVANIGSGKSKRLAELDGSEWQKMLDINLLAGAQLVRQVTAVMKNNKKGSIVFTTSIAGIENIGAPAAYAAAKAALLSYAKSLSNELASDNIRVNSVAPGNIKFPGGRWEELIKEKPEAVKEMLEKEVPLKRFGTVQEIADAVLFLSSDRASFVTGSCLRVDGGQTRSI